MFFGAKCWNDIQIKRAEWIWSQFYAKQIIGGSNIELDY